MKNIDIANLKYGKDGLIPAIVQDRYDKTVLMLAYMSSESLQLTIDTGYTHFYSRSRKKLWKKGEESGNLQKVTAISLDCDDDTLLVTVIQTNDIACHTGSRSCFFKKMTGSDVDVEVKSESSTSEMLTQLYNLIQDRKLKKPEGSYVSYLFEKGQDKILKKIGEEAGEVIIGSKNNDKDEIIYEMADLWFHSLVALGLHNISPEEIMQELASRHGKASLKK